MDAQLIAFTGVAAGMVALPGADFTVVVRNALASRTAGLATALGVAGGLLVHTALAVAGLAAVLVTLPVLFRTVQLLGGAYVLYLGISALYALRRRNGRSGQSEEGTADDGAGRPAPREFGRALRQGFLTNALNPKAPVLFLSLLPQFRAPRAAAAAPDPPAGGGRGGAGADLVPGGRPARGPAGPVAAPPAHRPRRRGRQRSGAHRAGTGPGHRPLLR